MMQSGSKSKPQSQFPGRETGAAAAGRAWPSLGCLLLVVACALGWLAWTADWKYAVPAVLLLIVVIVVGRATAAADRRWQMDVLHAAFVSRGCPVPALKNGSSYSFPTFTLIFPTEAEMNQSLTAGCVSAFKESIQARYAHVGRRLNPFDAGKAVYVACPGRLPREARAES